MSYFTSDRRPASVSSSYHRGGHEGLSYERMLDASKSDNIGPASKFVPAVVRHAVVRGSQCLEDKATEFQLASSKE